ncbi:uroporphyrinogen-III C-methyltransferase [Flavobacterium sp. N3904]|uniref:uroporphyrinogen-III C-methyltransferase n=1 Tax=Flavobacterium sp. N3904 TaxID=2986835 RepID=UPI0022256A1D|nr:uroporphyrinogen-III C-methyltransferase [Flavobacterium sp. N3904]
MIQINKPKLTIVGAGPGDAELITLKAIKALENADVVLYDALVNEELLQYAKQAEIIFVGKRFGCHAYSQDQINDLIVSMAQKYGHVVRLKGGDPFVFGRGSEEIDFAQQFGIETAIVPGISSALGVPACNGISLTQRKVAESFWVITGTTSDHKLSKDVALASQSSATVVILMGMNKLEEIVVLYQNNRTDDLPIAIIQNGTKTTEKKVIGTISSITTLVKENEIASPAIIIIGEVVKNASAVKSYVKNKLSKDLFLEEEFVLQNLDSLGF